jgi:hypothetical protein
MDALDVQDQLLGDDDAFGSPARRLTASACKATYRAQHSKARLPKLTRSGAATAEVERGHFRFKAQGYRAAD